ncbi:ricin-type beta-trefoil lectin domain protein [Kineococcus indalonis]|uniref:ricin-type beta-trefoil lectin domain protein n=1 Tax=Kineococcus indalonis TaxID=2696566 RepID=UPI0014131726|nr:ricin-type beta-trefoil lectin domain protein [Kineococcus indalonis]NAZ84614.1 hypothetical protein [Kineococcus indalonis]
MAALARLLRARLDRARQQGQDEGAALLLVMTSVLVATALSILVLGIVLSQVLPTQLQQKRTATLAAAQAGVEAASAQIRTAIGSSNNGQSFGTKNLLPCTVSGTAAGERYTVTITYYDTDPSDLPVAEQEIRRIDCSPATGTAYIPSHAVLRSTGTGASLPGRGATAGDRVVEALYSFELDNGNIPGGLMWTMPLNQYCLQAPATPAIGSKVTYAAESGCTFNDPRQMWIYNTDYTIVLSSTLATTPLCIDASTTAAADATLQKCDKRRSSQLFSYEGGSRFKGQNSANTDYGTRCLGVGSDPGTSPITGRSLRIGDCASDAEWGSFAPDPSVGAGAASYNTRQIVNYFEFGRCMDVTGEKIAAPQMIVYPCKQDPSGGSKLKWNHKWYYTENITTAQQISVLVNNSTSSKYCLTASPAGTLEENADVTFKTCDGRSEQRFTRQYKMPDYAESYTFLDFAGRCLSIGPKWNNGNYSRIVSAACNGGSAQKWNAPQLISDPGVTGVREVSRSGS